MLPCSPIKLISAEQKCNCMCIREPGWNIPSIVNLYNAEDQQKTIPLKNLKLNGNIVNSSATLNFVQTFTNNSEASVECIYKFPADYSFAVVGLSVQVGDKQIETEVMQKAEAEQKYDDAVAAGHTAVKLNYDEKLPDIIELNIGQLQSGATAEINVKMVCELEVIKHGFYSLIFPLDFFPRYGSKPGIFGETGEYLPANFEANFIIRSSSEITNLDVSHEGIKFEQSDDNKEILLELANSPQVKAQDFVLSYSIEEIREPQVIITKMQKYSNQAACHISFIPRISEEHQIDEEEEKLDFENYKLTKIDDHDTPDMAMGEFIFVLDRSGSMRGKSLNVALETLELFIRSIPQNSKFNVISFGSSYEPLFKESVSYNQTNMEEAISSVSQFSADMGGTELFEPINYVLSQKQYFKYPRNVFILTDGGISDTEDVLNIIKNSNKHTRVHSFGIGSGASIYLVKEIAKAGKGTSTLIPDDDKYMKSKVIKALNKASRPAFTNIKIDWKDNQKNILLQHPLSENISYAYEEEPFNLYAILSLEDLEEGKIDLSAYNTQSKKIETWTLPIDPSNIIESSIEHDFQLTAKYYLEELHRSSSETPDTTKEQIKTSIKYSVLCNKTAFVGIIKNKDKSNKEMQRIKIPIKKIGEVCDSSDESGSLCNT